MTRVLDESVFFKLVRVVNLTARPFNEGIGARHQLSLNEWRVMTVVAGHPGCTASDVCARTGMDKMSVSRAIVSLDMEHGCSGRRPSFRGTCRV